MTKLIIGIDVSKSTLDFAEFIAEKIQEEGQLKNELAEIRKFLKKFLKKYQNKEILVVLEPTGTYSDKIMSVLKQLDIPCSWVNTQQSHYYSMSKGVINKTDKQAARMLAEMGAKMELPIYVFPTQQQVEQKDLILAINTLQSEKQAFENRIGAQKEKAVPTKTVVDCYKAMVKKLETEIKILEQQLCDIKDEEFEKKKKLAMSIKGIGPVNANWLLIISNGLENFDCHRQFVRFLGLSPQSHYSGTSVRKKKGINKSGKGKVRGNLFNAARSASQYNLACKQLYDRLKEKGKGHYRAMVAVMRKLAVQFFHVVKSGIEFDNQYHLKFQKK